MILKPLKQLRNCIRLNQKSQQKFFEELKQKAFSQFEQSRKEKRDRMFSRKDKQKQEFHEDIENQAERMAQEDEFKSKEDFIQSLRKERHKYEEEREKSKQEWADLDQRMMRESQVKFEQVDFTKLMMTNINIIPVQTFAHPDQLFYYVGNLNMNISEENIIKCIDGFLSLSDQIQEEQISSNAFLQFSSIVEDNIYIIANEENLIKIAQFGDLYCIDQGRFWEILERKFLQQINKMQSKTIVSLLGSFANQKEGSDRLYNDIQQIFHEQLKQNTLPFPDCVKIAQGFFRVQAGTMDFFEYLQDHIANNIQHSTFSELIVLSQVFKNIKEKKELLFNKIEQQTLHYLDKYENQNQEQLNVSELCLIADGFGFELGSDYLMDRLSNLIAPILEQQANNKQDLSIFITGFLHSYRGNKTVLKLLSEKIFKIVEQQYNYMVQNKANKEEMDYLAKQDFYSVSELAEIVKSFYIAEYEDKQLDFIIEQFILSQIKDVSRITTEELLDCVKSYTITRNGSRQIYKLLELVIKHRMRDIQKDNVLAQKIYVYYAKSGLCSPKLLEELELLI